MQRISFSVFPPVSSTDTSPPDAAPKSTGATGFDFKSSFSAPVARAGAPDPSDGDVTHWQAFCEQFRAQAETELNRKRGSEFPDKDVQRVIRDGGGPVYVGGRSTAPGKTGNPIFFQNFPSDQNVAVQLYSFQRNGQFVSFDVSGDFAKAYNDDAFTGFRKGTNSALGFPDSGREFANGTHPDLLFQGDPQVASAIAAKGQVAFQKFENGWLVQIAPGQVQAFDLTGSRMGTPYPGGTSVVAPPVGPGSASKPGSVYAPFEVTPGVSVNGRLGFSWPIKGLSSEQVDSVIRKAKEMGAGYTTLVLGPGEVAGNAALIQKLQSSGITPVVRIYQGKPPDLWGQPEIDQAVDEAKALADLGVQLVQVGNEPNIEGQLNGRGVSTADYLSRSTANQAKVLLAIRNAVGDRLKLGPPPVAAGSDNTAEQFSPQDYFAAEMSAIRSLEKSSGKNLVDWLPVHNYVYLDGENTGTTVRSGGARGMLGWGPATSSWYETTAQTLLGRSVKSLSTEGGATPDAFRGPVNGKDNSNPARTQRELDDTLRQLNSNTGYTASLWLLRSSDPAKDQWDSMALLDGEGPFAAGLVDYRNARTAAS